MGLHAVQKTVLSKKRCFFKRAVCVDVLCIAGCDLSTIAELRQLCADDPALQPE
jgi:hypothetical protein